MINLYIMTGVLSSCHVIFLTTGMFSSQLRSPDLSVSEPSLRPQLSEERLTPWSLLQHSLLIIFHYIFLYLELPQKMFSIRISKEKDCCDSGKEKGLLHTWSAQTKSSLFIWSFMFTVYKGAILSIFPLTFFNYNSEMFLGVNMMKQGWAQQEMQDMKMKGKQFIILLMIWWYSESGERTLR